MDDILNDSAEDAEAMGAAAPAEAEAGTPAPDGEPVAPAAPETEPRERRDWKEKAIRAEAERDTMRAQLHAARPVSTPSVDALFNERLNVSEALLRQQHDDVDARIAVFRQAAEANPALRQALREQAHPYQWAYEQGKRLQLLAEIGADPEAYRRRVEEEVRARVLGGARATAALPASLPASLAGVPAAASRQAAPWTGPTPLTEILPG